MTKKEWVDFLRDAVSGGDTPDERKRRFHPVIVEKTIDVALTGYLTQPDMATNMKSVADWKLNALTKMYKADIKEDEIRRKYVELPQGVVPMKNNAQFRDVVAQDKSLVFTYRSVGTTRIYKELDVDVVSNTVPMTAISNRLYFDSVCEGLKKGSPIYLYLVVRFSAFDDDEEVNIPGEMEMLVYNNVRQMLLNRPPEDNLNDNANNPI